MYLNSLSRGTLNFAFVVETWNSNILWRLLIFYCHAWRCTPFYYRSNPGYLARFYLFVEHVQTKRPSHSPKGEEAQALTLDTVPQMRGSATHWVCRKCVAYWIDQYTVITQFGWGVWWTRCYMSPSLWQFPTGRRRAPILHLAQALPHVPNSSRQNENDRCDTSLPCMSSFGPTSPLVPLFTANHSIPRRGKRTALPSSHDTKTQDDWTHQRTNSPQTTGKPQTARERGSMAIPIWGVWRAEAMNFNTYPHQSVGMDKERSSSWKFCCPRCWGVRETDLRALLRCDYAHLVNVKLKQNQPNLIWQISTSTTKI